MVTDIPDPRPANLSTWPRQQRFHRRTQRLLVFVRAEDHYIRMPEPEIQRGGIALSVGDGGNLAGFADLLQQPGGWAADSAVDPMPIRTAWAHEVSLRERETEVRVGLPAQRLRVTGIRQWHHDDRTG